MHEPGRPSARLTLRRLMQVSDGRHDHRQRHRYCFCSRLCARQHRPDHRVPVGRVRDRMVHRSAARAPPRRARRRVTYRAAILRLPAPYDMASGWCMLKTRSLPFLAPRWISFRCVRFVARVAPRGVFFGAAAWRVIELHVQEGRRRPLGLIQPRDCFFASPSCFGADDGEGCRYLAEISP